MKTRREWIGVYIHVEHRTDGYYISYEPDVWDGPYRNLREIGDVLADFFQEKLEIKFSTPR